MEKPTPQPGEHYRHYKGGEYEILMLANHTERAGETLVIYRSLQYGSIWARPLPVFQGDVVLLIPELDGAPVVDQRFTRCDSVGGAP